jgi:hypothetical protein
MNKPLDLANAQVSLDRDRENVETVARKLYTYCAALRERIRRYYGCMDTAEKWAGMVEQAQKCAGLMPILSDFIEYFQDGEEKAGPWSSIDSVPEYDRDLTAEEREGVRERIRKEEASLRRAAPDALVEALKAVRIATEEAEKHLEAVHLILDAALRPVEHGEDAAREGGGG